MTFYTGRCKKIYAVEELENLQARRQFYLTAGEISCPINKLFIYTPPLPLCSTVLLLCHVTHNLVLEKKNIVKLKPGKICSPGSLESTRIFLFCKAMY